MHLCVHEFSFQKPFAYGKSFELLNTDDFLLINKDLKIVKGNNSGFPNRCSRFHYHIYKNRDDIKCIIHTHPRMTSALSMIGQELLISHMGNF